MDGCYFIYWRASKTEAPRGINAPDLKLCQSGEGAEGKDLIGKGADGDEPHALEQGQPTPWGKNENQSK